MPFDFDLIEKVLSTSNQDFVQLERVRLIDPSRMYPFQIDLFFA